MYDGQDAYDYCLGISYDGIILDWMMPKMDGVTVLQKLRRQGYSVPCLILTANDSVTDKVEGLDSGADDYLPKPFATPELLAQIRALLRRKQDYNPDKVSFGDLELD